MSYINKLLILQIFIFSATACADNNPEITAVDNPHSSYLQVTGVEDNDTLNLRNSPSGKSETVYKLPPNAKGILKLGNSKGWIQLSYKEYTGWAYGKYLKDDNTPEVTSELKNELFCLGTEPHWILKTHNNELTYKKYDDEAQYIFNSSFEKDQKKAVSWSFSAVKQGNANNPINVVIKHNEQCSDEMSDNKYTYSISVNDKEMGLLKGCCK